MAEAKHVWTASEAEAVAFDFSHSLRPESSCRMVPLSRLAGLGQVGLNLVTVAPGDQAFPHHRHHAMEEWTYIVAGDALVRIGEDEHALGAGDFVAFPAGGEAHSVRNASDSAPLVCLMGGASVAADLVDFPEFGIRVTRSGAITESAPASAFAPFRFRAAPKEPDA